jgi:hypothetical protein
MRWCFIVVGLLALLNLAGCGSKKTEGSTTVETNALHNTVKVSSKEGTAIIGRGAVNAKELGLPIYPGTIAAQTGGLTANNAKGTTREVSLTTKDSFDQVYQWYKRQLPANTEQTHMEVAGGSVASFLVGKINDADQKSVLISQSKDTTTILLTHITKRV